MVCAKYILAAKCLHLNTTVSLCQFNNSLCYKKTTCARTQCVTQCVIFKLVSKCLVMRNCSFEWHFCDFFHKSVGSTLYMYMAQLWTCVNLHEKRQLHYYGQSIFIEMTVQALPWADLSPVIAIHSYNRINCIV